MHIFTFYFNGDKKFLADSEEKYERLLNQEYHLPWSKDWKDGQVIFYVYWELPSDLCLASALCERTKYTMTFKEKMRHNIQDAKHMQFIIDHMKNRRSWGLREDQIKEKESNDRKFLKSYYHLSDKEIDSYLKS